MASRIRGIIRTRRLLRGIEPQSRAEVYDALKQFGEEVLADQRSRAAVLRKPDKRRRAGHLRDALRLSLSPRTLRLQVGLVSRKRKDYPFWGLWIQYGRKGGVAEARRGAGVQTETSIERRRVQAFRKDGSAYVRIENLFRRRRTGGQVYQVRVGALPARPFLYNAGKQGTDLRNGLIRRVKAAFDAGLRKLAASAGALDG